MSEGVASGLTGGSRPRAWQWAVNALEKYSAVMPSPEQEERQEVVYKPAYQGKIEVGYRATVIPVNHHPSAWVNSGLVVTGKVVAYDAVTGNFETKSTRYLLDNGYEH